MMFYYANSPIAIDNKLHEDVENKIFELTRGSGRKLYVDRTNPDFEYWFLYRKEGYGFFGLRLTKHPDYKDTLAKGQLRPELANIMVLLSNPHKDDVILDPFAGSGAIPIERAKYPYQKIIAGDINPEINWQSRGNTDTSTYRSIYAQTRQNYARIYMLDALAMKGIADESVNKIITDPPWGIYSTNGDIHSFYVQMLNETLRVLRSGGLIVMLVGRNVDMEKILAAFAERLELIKSYNILVSGKKAGIFVISKN